MAMDMDIPNKLSSQIINYNHKETWNSFFLFFMIIGYIFGVVFYEFLPVSWLDELMCVLLIFVYLYRWKYYDVKYKKLFVGFILVSLFYLSYSFYIESNVSKAILSDYIVQIKSFIAFIVIIGISPEINKQKKEVLKKITYIVWILLVIVGFSDEIIALIFSHPSRFATTATINGMIYYYACDKFDRSDFIKLIIMVGVGLFSARTKFYGFYFLFCVYLYLHMKNYKLTFSLKNIFIASSLLAITVYLCWTKIDYYFIEGVFESEEAFARPILYITSGSVFMDYFPFGSGLASCATYFSGEYYSKIYSEYDIENYWGISEDYNSFIADTFYPSLAQLGVVGIVLYIGFFYWVFKKFGSKSSELNCRNSLKLSYAILVFFIIESTSDSTFSQNRGFYLMMLLGLCFVENISTEEKETKKKIE